MLSELIALAIKSLKTNAIRQSKSLKTNAFRVKLRFDFEAMN